VGRDERVTDNALEALPASARAAAGRTRTGRTGRDPMSTYAYAAVLADGLAVLVAVFTALLLGQVWSVGSVVSPLEAVLLVFVWLLLLALAGGYDTRIVGGGAEEFRRLVIASLWMLAVVAIVEFFVSLDLSRAFVIMALPLGLGLLIADRWALRVMVRASRPHGRFMHRCVVVADGLAAHALTDSLGNAAFGYSVTSVVAPPRKGDDVDAWVERLAAQIIDDDVHAVVVGDSDVMVPDLLRRLSWRLDGAPIDLLVSPTLGDLAGPRVVVRAVPWLQLFQLDEPMLSGPKRFTKRFIDIVGAAVGIVVLLPVFVVVALAIGITSRGGVLYSQDRVAERGGTFRCYKFRTMVDGADRQRDSVIGAPDLYIAERYRSDPRVTPVGRVLRRWSIDELPQLFHVLSGRMSLVGPRPMLIDELPLLTDDHHRRHIIRPGLTGLWQVKGRKDVSWEERMRLDLQYLDRWSIPLDLAIMLKSVYVVLTGRGAY